MTRHIFDSRRALVQVLLAVNLVIWSACFAWADDEPNTASKPAEYAAASFQSGGKTIRLWRFDSKAEGKQPAVLLLYGVDGLENARDVYCAVAKRLAGKGYAVFLVHYLDGLAAEDRKSIGELVKRGLSGTATAEEMRRVHDHFEIWMDCVRDALVHVRNQPRVDSERVGVVGVSLGGFVGLACAGRKDLKLAAAIACFGGLPRAMQERLQSLPPTLVIHGDKDDVVPVEEAHALRKLAADKKLPIEVTIYPGVGHVFRTAEGKFDLASLKDADQRITEHLHKHLTAEGTQAKSNK